MSSLQRSLSSLRSICSLPRHSLSPSLRWSSLGVCILPIYLFVSSKFLWHAAAPPGCLGDIIRLGDFGFLFFFFLPLLWNSIQMMKVWCSYVCSSRWDAGVFVALREDEANPPWWKTLQMCLCCPGPYIFSLRCLPDCHVPMHVWMHVWVCDCVCVCVLEWSWSALTGSQIDWHMDWQAGLILTKFCTDLAVKFGSCHSQGDWK